MLLHYLGKFKIKFCTFQAHKTFQTFKCDFLSPNQQISLKCHEKSAKSNTIQNINILLFVRSLLSKVGLSTIKHQHRKNLTQWTELTTHEKCKLFASFFTKVVQNVHHLHEHMPGDTFSTGQLHCR